MLWGDFLHNNIYGKWFFWIFVVSAVLAEITVVYYGKAVFLMPDYIYCPTLFFLCLGLIFVGYSLYRLVYRRWNNQRQILLRSIVGFIFVALAYSVFVPNVVVVDEKSTSAQLVNPQSVIEDFRSPEVDKINLNFVEKMGKIVLLNMIKIQSTRNLFLIPALILPLCQMEKIKQSFTS